MYIYIYDVYIYIYTPYIIRMIGDCSMKSMATASLSWDSPYCDGNCFPRS